MSSKRSRRSLSGSRSPDHSSSRSKRSLDLVSTRRMSPPRFNQRFFRGGRGRGRGPRRPFVHRGARGFNNYRRPQRYYPRYQQYSSRNDSHNRHRRSHSRDRSRSHSRDRSREKSISRDRHYSSESDSSSSDSGSVHRPHPSLKRQQHPAAAKDVVLSHLRSSISPEDVPITKKSRRQSSSSPDMQDSKSSISRSNSFTKQESNGRNQHHPVSTYDEDNSKYADRRLSKGSVEQSDVRVKKHRKKSRSSSPEMSHIKKSATASKAKEHIPRYRLHKIFSLISQDSDFVLDEDISIAIQRNPYAEPSEDSTVTVVLDVELFSMIYPNKGRKHTPIFDREDIKKFGHDKNLADDPDFERRVIRVKPGKSSSGQTDPGPSTSSYQQSSSLMITRTVNRNRSQSSSRSRSRSAPRTTKPRDPQIKLRVSTDARFETRYAEIQKRGDSGSSRRSNLEPNDLRHELSTSRRLSSEGRTPVDREKGHFDDRRQSDDRCQSDDRRHSNDRRQSESHREHKQELKKDREELPDFSRRKDKYQYTPWLDQPELIPKDPKYFMHDDRESMDFRNRDRGRGRFFRGRTNFRRPFRPFRSRGNFRGPYRGRGFGPSNPQPRSPRRNSFSDNSYSGYKKSEEREWKHDKFSELERGDGEKKSRQQDSQHQHSTSDR